MGNNTRNTRAAVSRVEFDALSSSVAQILALLTKPEPVSLERKTAKKRPTKARKAAATKAKATTAAKAKAVAKGPKCLTRKTRPEFVKANPAFAGKTTGEIQQMLLDGASFEGNWTVGPRTVAFFETGAYPATEKKSGKKARKATATKVVAEVKASTKAKAERKPEPEYGTEAWIAWARPTDDGAPRRANGTVAPKAEWATRIALEATGKFDRHEVDAVLANA